MSLTADNVLGDINVIRNALVIQRYNINVNYTSTSVPNTSIPTTLSDQNGNSVSAYLGQAPLLLHSLAFTYGSSFQSNFALYVKLKGLNIDNNQFNNPASGTNGFDYVPTGKKFLIPANQTLDVYSYMNGSATQNQPFSILAIFEKLDTLAPDEQSKL